MSPKTSVEFREQGNQAFKEGNFKLAVDRYTDAIEVLQQETLNDEIKNDLTKCFSNRAQCHINLQEYEDAIDDATRGSFESLSIDSLNLRKTSFCLSPEDHERNLFDRKLFSKKISMIHSE